MPRELPLCTSDSQPAMDRHGALENQWQNPWDGEDLMGKSSTNLINAGFPEGKQTLRQAPERKIVGNISKTIFSSTSDGLCSIWKMASGQSWAVVVQLWSSNPAQRMCSHYVCMMYIIVCVYSCNSFTPAKKRFWMWAAPWYAQCRWAP